MYSNVVRPGLHLTHTLPSKPPQHWELRLGNELLAELFFESYETPWIDVSIEALPALDPFWRNFQDSRTWADDDATIDAMLLEIDRRGGFTLIPDGEPPTRTFTLINLDERGGNLRY